MLSKDQGHSLLQAILISAYVQTNQYVVDEFRKSVSVMKDLLVLEQFTPCTFEQWRHDLRFHHSVDTSQSTLFRNMFVKK